MAHLIEIENLQSGYLDLIEYVTKNGRETAPRGLPIVEVTDVAFTVEQLDNVLPTNIGRKPNLKIAAIEALQLVAGASRPHLVIGASAAFRNYTEPDGTFHGAYGDRIGDQSNHVCKKLLADRASRQAIITLWNPVRDNGDAQHRDYPCTIALGFRIRDARLDLSVLMRSNDVWLGTTYDVFQFTQLQWTIAYALGIEVGRYTHTAWSLHVYERDLSKIALLHKPDQDDYPAHPRGLPEVDQWDGTIPFRTVAKEIMDDEADAWVLDDPSHRWYHEQARLIHRSL